MPIFPMGEPMEDHPHPGDGQLPLYLFHFLRGEVGDVDAVGGPQLDVGQAPLGHRFQLFVKFRGDLVGKPGTVPDVP